MDDAVLQTCGQIDREFSNRMKSGIGHDVDVYLLTIAEGGLDLVVVAQVGPLGRPRFLLPVDALLYPRVTTAQAPPSRLRGIPMQEPATAFLLPADRARRIILMSVSHGVQMTWPKRLAGRNYS